MKFIKRAYSLPTCEKTTVWTQGRHRRSPAAPAWGMIWQRVADFEAFRQVAEQGGTFFGQNPSQPMAHEHQDGSSSRGAFELPLHKGMMGKHGLGAMGEFVRERFRDGCPKIIVRLVEDAPGQIQRSATWRSFTWTITGAPFKFSDRLVTFCLSGARPSTLVWGCFMRSILFQPVRQRLSKLSIPEPQCCRNQALGAVRTVLDPLM